MLSYYFQRKTKTRKFDNDLLWSMGEIKDKKIILYGAGEEFFELNKKYDFTNTLNIVAIADNSLEHHCNCGCECHCKHEIEGVRAIAPHDILNEDYDVILITDENPKQSLDIIFNTLNIQGKDVRTVFNEDVRDEQANLNYLSEHNFEKTLPKLIKKLHNKSVMFYGAGVFFELIKQYFDISDLNVIGIADKRFENHSENEEFLGYKVYAPKEIKDVNPDYVIVTTRTYIDIIEDLYYNTLKDSKIKIKPLVQKSFFTLIKEIWS